MHENTQRITVRDVSKTIKGRVILDRISLELARGGIYGFYGVNGSGKTMLFRAIAGLIRIDEGEISVFGEKIGVGASFPRSLGLIIESVGLWDEYTGLVNLKMLASIKNEIDERAIREAIKRVGLDPDDKRTYRKYSLGMKQRIAIAQAIMEQPELLILDEPTNALDEDGKKLVHDIIIEERQRGATILIASHDHEELASLCDRQYKLYEGRLGEG